MLYIHNIIYKYGRMEPSKRQSQVVGGGAVAYFVYVAIFFKKKLHSLHNVVLSIIPITIIIIQFQMNYPMRAYKRKT